MKLSKWKQFPSEFNAEDYIAKAFFFSSQEKAPLTSMDKLEEVKQFKCRKFGCQY